VKIKYIICALLILNLNLSYSADQRSSYSIYTGIIFPQNYNTGFHAGATINFGDFIKKTSFLTNLTYMTARKDDQRFNFSDFLFSAELRSYSSYQSVKYYFGGGIGLNLLTWKESEIYTDSTRVEEYLLETFENRISFYPVIGFIKDFSRISLFIEMKYHLISEFNNFQISAGIIFGKRE